jgi:protein ImuB
MAIRRQPKSGPVQADLFPEPVAAIKKIPRQAVRTSTPRLWLCLAFPDLPLEALAMAAEAPVAVVEQIGSASSVLSCNAAARAQGVASGLPVNAALALSPELCLYDREAHREALLLEQLCVLARGFTPVVNVASESALLLEMKGSLPLFGGLQPLLRALRHAFQSYRVCMASSPAPQAALWLVQAGAELHLDDMNDPRLRSLPVSALNWPERQQKQFSRIGVKTLGECVRLPRDGFAKRFGVICLQELDRGFGRRPDLRPACAEQETFDSLLELPMETSAYQQIAVVLDEHLLKLETFLRQRQLAVQQFRISLLQRAFVIDMGTQNSITEVDIGVLNPQPGVEGLAELIALRFERIELTAPVYAVQLCATAFFSLDENQLSAADDAFPDPRIEAVGNQHHAAGGRALRLIEMLRQRMGYQCVYSLSAEADHRPECAWKKSEPLKVNTAAIRTVVSRPIWLLDEPKLLSAPDTLPLQPERIESGWWDGADTQRDYFQWRHRSGQRCWVFRDEAGWYLHGLFG